MFYIKVFKIFPLLLVFIIILNPIYAFSAPADFSGGVNNEYRYEEVVFITGEPIKFSGNISISEREKDTEKTVSYKFDLTAEGEEKMKLKRTVSYATKYDVRNDKGQIIAQTELKKYNEKIEIGKDKYELEDYQFSKSDVIDKRAASDFYSGNFKGRKYYKINKDEGEVIIDISGGDVGYENFWGSTETQIIDYHISCQRLIIEQETEDNQDEKDEDKKDEDKKDEDKTKKEETKIKIHWDGTVGIQISDSMTKTLYYSDNEANLTSFDGGYTRKTNREMVSKYEFDLPKMKDDKPDKNKRNRDSISISADMVPKIERLVVPKFKDTRGHWAESYIEKLYSLDVFDESQNFFGPNAYMTRAEFTKGVIKACDIRIPKTDEKKAKRRKQPPEESPFKDVSVDAPEYDYIKGGLDKGIISGVSKELFAPNEPLTRAQAIAILIRALGFSNKAPNPGYYTSFADDNKIPNWAKDSIYVAREISLIEGDDYNRVNPDKKMSRAEASAMLVRFLEFLQNDLQRDYRENIILFK